MQIRTSSGFCNSRPIGKVYIYIYIISSENDRAENVSRDQGSRQYCTK